MKLHFRTRDAGVGNDYPSIDWMPPLPKGTERLWHRFGYFSKQTYPQLVLSAESGSWQLYLEGLDSGRNDALSGIGGRIIRNSLFITGKLDEADTAYGIIAAYIGDFSKTDPATPIVPQKTFLKAFLQTVKAGEARRLKDGGSDIQAKAADATLAAIVECCKGIGASQPAHITEQGQVVATLTAEGRAAFLRACTGLLRGNRQGCAVALSNARLTDLRKVESLAGEKVVAFLSLDVRDIKSAGETPPARGSARPKESGALQMNTPIPVDDDWGTFSGDYGSGAKGRGNIGGLAVGGVATVSVVILLLLFRWLFSPSSSSRQRVPSGSGAGMPVASPSATTNGMAISK